MDYDKIGSLILYLRKEKGLTQKQLADRLNVSDRAVSKWERSLGLPDISLLKGLSDIFGVNIEKILEGDLNANDFIGGNMKNTKYYVCPFCGNIVLATGNAEVSCCGRKMEEKVMKKAEESQKLKVETLDGDYFITSDHPMTKDHYISFAAFATGESIQIIKKYPEWDFECRIPKKRHGMLIWYCTRDGLFYQYI